MFEKLKKNIKGVAMKAAMAGIIVGMFSGLLYAFGVPFYYNQTGAVVVSSSSVKVERLTLVTTSGATAINFYNATSATGAVAANLAMSVTVPASLSLTASNTLIELFAQFPHGLVISTVSGNPNTPTAFLTFNSGY
jgi:hypothetical protein